MENEVELSRAKTYKQKRWKWRWRSGKQAKQPTVPALLDNGITTMDRINIRHTFIIGAIIMALIYIFNTVGAMERDIYVDDQIDLNMMWNFVIYMIKGMVCSIFIPIVFYLFHFAFYFIQDSRITLVKIEKYFTIVLYYCGLSILCALAFPLLFIYLLVNVLQNHQLDSISYLIVAVVIALVLLGFYLIIRVTSTKRYIGKSYGLYVMMMFLFMIAFYMYPSAKSAWFPSIAVSSTEFYSSKDDAALVKFKGNAVGAYLVPAPYEDNEKEKGIRLKEIYVNPGVRQFLIDFTDPRITADSYDIVIIYQSEGWLPPFTSASSSGGEKKISRRVAYIFDGGIEDKADYLNRYMTLLKREGPAKGVTPEALDKTLAHFAKVFQANRYDFRNQGVQSLLEPVRTQISPDAQDVFSKMITDSVFNTN